MPDEHSRAASSGSGRSASHRQTSGEGRRILEELGAEAVDIEVLSWNEGGIGFWESLGFKERSIYMRYEKTRREL